MQSISVLEQNLGRKVSLFRPAAHRLQPNACPGVVHSYVFKRNVLNTTRHFRTDGDAVTRADDVVPEDNVL